MGSQFADPPGAGARAMGKKGAKKCGKIDGQAQSEPAKAESPAQLPTMEDLLGAGMTVNAASPKKARIHPGGSSVASSVGFVESPVRNFATVRGG